MRSQDSSWNRAAMGSLKAGEAWLILVLMLLFGLFYAWSAWASHPGEPPPFPELMQ